MTNKILIGLGITAVVSLVFVMVYDKPKLSNAEFIRMEIQRECDPLRTLNERQVCENYQWNRIK